MTIIAHEHIQQIRTKDLILVSIMSVITSIIIYFSNWLASPSTSLIISIIVIVFFMNLTIYVSRKTGMASIFFVLTGLLTFPIDDFGVTGWGKVLVFLLASIIFEMVYLFLKMHIHNIQMDMVVGSTLTMMVIPLFVALFISPELATTFPEALINFILLGFTFGLASSVVTSLFWHFIRASGFVLSLETKLMTLGKI